MSKRISHADHTTVSLPRRGRYLPHDPTTGIMEKFDAGLLTDLRSALAPGGGVTFDGTASAKVLVTLTGQNIATDPCSLTVGMLEIPAANPASIRNIVALTSDSAANAAGYALVVYVSTAGNLGVDLFGATTGDWRSAQSSASVVTSHGGKRVLLAIVRGADGSLSVYIDGIALTMAADTTGGTPPANWLGSITSTYLVIGSRGSTSWVGRLGRVSFYNLTLALADVEEIWFLNGAVPARLQWGSQVAVYASDFSAGVDGWASDQFTPIGNIDTNADGAGVPPSDNWLRGVTDATEAASLHSNTIGIYKAGTKIRVKADIFCEAASGATHVRLTNVSGGSTLVAEKYAAITAGAVTSIDQTVEMAVRSDFAIYLALNVGGSGGSTPFASGTRIYAKNVQMFIHGAVVHLPMDDGIGYQVHDESSNKLDAVMTTTGVSHLAPKRTGYVRGTLTWAATHEPKSLLGQRDMPNGAVVTLLTRSATAGSSGTGCTIGTTNSVTRWQAADTFTNAKEVATLANQLPAGTADGDNDTIVDPDSANFTGSITVEKHYTLTEGNP